MTNGGSLDLRNGQMDYALKGFIDNKDLCPCIDPDFDHSPRSAYRGIILHGSTPEKWGKLVNKTCNLLSDKTAQPTNPVGEVLAH